MVFTRLLAAIEHRPLLAATTITGVKTCIADILVQRYIAGKETHDPKRTLVFGTFGFFYQGGFQYLIFSVLYEKLMPTPVRAASKLDKAHISRVVQKIAITMGVTDPFLFFPTFYFIREFVNSEETSSLIPKLPALWVAESSASPSRARESQREEQSVLDFKQVPELLRTLSCRTFDIWKENVVSDVAANTTIWVPGHAVTFSLAPHLRMPWVAGLSFAWCVLLSYRRGEHQKAEMIAEEQVS